MSFTGLVAELPIGSKGLVGSKNQALIAPGHLLTADNLSYFGDVLTKEGGATKYNATEITATPAVLAGIDWWPTPGTQRMVVVTQAGEILKDDGGGTFGTVLKTGLTITADDIPEFVEGGKEAAANDRKLFIYVPGVHIQVLAEDAATTTDIATPTGDWTAGKPTTGNMHVNRHWATGNSNDPYRVYYSSLTNHEEFTGGTAGSFAVYPGEGEKNVKLISFKGLQVIFRYPRGIYVIDTRDPTPGNWSVDRLSRTLGAAGSGCVVPVEDDVLFMDVTGNIHLLSTVTEFGNLGTRTVSDIANFQTYIKENANIGKLLRARSVLYPRRREVHFALAGTGSTRNNARLVMDITRPEDLKFRWSTRDVCESLWLRRNSDGEDTLTSGDASGFVWLMDQETKSKDSGSYAGIFQSSHDDLSWLDPKLATIRKNGKFLELVVEPIGNWNMDVGVYWDGVLHQTVSFNMGVTGVALGSFELGSDILGNSPLANRKRRVTGSGRRISLRGINSGAGQDFSVLRFLLHFKPSGERLEADAS